MATKKEAVANEQEQQTTEAQAQQQNTDPQAEVEQIIAQAKAEAAKILADAKAKADAAHVEKAKAPAPSPTKSRAEELVPVRLFKDNEKYKDDVFVAVNGERVQIRRGEVVHIKRKYAEVLEQSMRQDTATANMIERQSAEYEARAKALNI